MAQQDPFSEADQLAEVAADVLLSMPSEAAERGQEGRKSADTDVNRPSEAANGSENNLQQSRDGDENNLQLSRRDENNLQQSRDDDENNLQLSDEWAWRPSDLKRRTCKHSTREAIHEHVPAAENDDKVFRYCVYVGWATFDDRQCGLQALPESACDWIAGYTNETAIEVIQYIQQHVGLEYIPHIPNRRCRLIKEDGLPGKLHRIIREDLSTNPSDYDERVYILSGAPYTAKKVTKRREEIREDLKEERHKTPSVGAQETFELLNFGCGEDLRSSRLTSKMTDHLDQAFAYVRQMDIDPDISKDEDETWESWRRRKRKAVRDQRKQYFNALSAIADQHQPFYSFSNGGRTDRVFGYNKGVMALPKEVRAILCQDFVEVDLKSAHLLIAAWLWDAEEALEKLSEDDYSIWDDLMEHYGPLFRANGHEVPEKGDDLYATVKSALKVAIYSTVYGMPAPSIQAEVTKSLKDVLGPEAGVHLRGHPIVSDLLEKRDEKLQEMEVGDVLHGPTGIEIEIEESLDGDGDGVDPKSAMATLAQSYEQAAMQVILEMERDRDQSGTYNHFNVALWLHDGAYVRLRSERARTKDLNNRLQKRCRELAEHAGKEDSMPAFFEVEPIDPPEPTEDNSCETSQTQTTNETMQTTGQNENPSRTSPNGTVPGAESPSSVEASSPGSDTSTASAKRGSTDEPDGSAAEPPDEAYHPCPQDATQEQIESWAELQRNDEDLFIPPASPAYVRKFGHDGMGDVPDPDQL